MKDKPTRKRIPHQIIVTLPEDDYTLRAMLDGGKWQSVVEAVDRALRDGVKYKYCEKKYDMAAAALQEIRDLLYEELREQHLSLDE